jgi:hypothetical protein
MNFIPTIPPMPLNLPGLLGLPTNPFGPTGTGKANTSSMIEYNSSNISTK